MRLHTFRVIASLLALTLFAFGGQLLVGGWTSSEHAIHEIAWGVTEGLLMVTALAVMVRHPDRHPGAMRQLLAATTALLLTMVLVAAVDAFTLVLGALVGVLALLHPARAELLRFRRPAPAVVAALGVAAVALIAVAVDQAALQRGASDAHAALDHYTGTTAAALGILLVGLVAAGGASGERLPAWTAGLGLAVLGAASAAFPSQVSSLGVAGGLGVLVVGLGVLAAGEAARRSAHNRAGDLAEHEGAAARAAA